MTTIERLRAVCEKVIKDDAYNLQDVQDVWEYLPQLLDLVERQNEALKFYAHPSAYQAGHGVMRTHPRGNYFMPSNLDRGETAREALTAYEDFNKYPLPLWRGC